MSHLTSQQQTISTIPWHSMREEKKLRGTTKDRISEHVLLLLARDLWRRVSTGRAPGPTPTCQFQQRNQQCPLVRVTHLKQYRPENWRLWWRLKMPSLRQRRYSLWTYDFDFEVVKGCKLVSKYERKDEFQTAKVQKGLIMLKIFANWNSSFVIWLDWTLSNPQCPMM